MLQLLLILGQWIVYLLYALIFTGMALLLTLLFNTPMRKTVLGLDILKWNLKGLRILKIAIGAMILALIEHLVICNLISISAKNVSNNAVELIRTGEVFRAMNVLQLFLIEILLFLLLIADGMHKYMRGLPKLMMAMEAAKTAKLSFQVEKFESGNKINIMVQEKDALRTKIKHLQSEIEREANEANEARAEAEALRQQSEGFREEYDRLLDGNQNLRILLRFVEQRCTTQSTSDEPHDKKNL